MIFIHLDLGIGGAEQLVLQLATAAAVATRPDEHTTSSTTATATDVRIYTTRCDPWHCFAAVKPPDGMLSRNVRVHGRWIPATIFGKGRVVCSTLRMLYLALCVIIYEGNAADIIVMDVLPTPLPLLKAWLRNAGLLFYCHFPDVLLKQTQQQEQNQQQQQQSSSSSSSLLLWDTLIRFYRSCTFYWEQQSMLSADCICVNSLFTKQVLQTTFPLLRDADLPVLYPALNKDDMNDNDNDIDTHNTHNNTQRDNNSINNNTTSIIKDYSIVSLNRYERKKNIAVLLHAMHWIQTNHTQKQIQIPKIIIAGGYDTQCVENVEHHAELQQLTKQLGLQDSVVFCRNVKDEERSQLLAKAHAVIYTPTNEHFGIVPLEAMAASTCVIAMNSGGPKETIVHGKTGLLCDESTPECLGAAILQILQHPERAMEMGRAGRMHVQERFGTRRLQTEFQALLEETHRRACMRQQSSYHLGRGLVVYLMEALLILLFLWILTISLRFVGVLQHHQSILGTLILQRQDDYVNEL